LLLKRDVEVIRVPWDYDFNGLEFDGLFISNGPGDPDTCDAAVQNIRKAIHTHRLIVATVSVLQFIYFGTSGFRE